MKKIVENPSLNMSIGTELATFLKLQGFIVQIFQEKSGVVCVRLDCGMANTIKIGNLKASKNLKYMFLIDPTIEMGRMKIVDRTTQYSYGKGIFDRMQLLQDLNENKTKKTKSAGGYTKYIEKMFYKQTMETSSKGRWGNSSYV